MHIHAAGKDIGTRKPLEAELCTISTTAYGRNLRLETGLAHGLLGHFYNMHDRLNLLTHIIILVAHLQSTAAGKLSVSFVNQMLHLALAAFKACTVVVAYYILESGLLYTA